MADLGHTCPDGAVAFHVLQAGFPLLHIECFPWVTVESYNYSHFSGYVFLTHPCKASRLDYNPA